MPEYKLSDIEEKFQLLLKRLQSFQKERENLVYKIQEKEKKIKDLQEKMNEYEEKISIFRMTSPEGDGEKEDTKARKEIRTTINSYIKEIDNCIAQLNK